MIKTIVYKQDRQSIRMLSTGTFNLITESWMCKEKVKGKKATATSTTKSN